AILAHFRLRKISLAGGTHCRICAYRGRALGNSEWRDAPLFAAPLRTRSGGSIGTIRRDAGRCNGIGNLFQCRAIRSSWDLAVIRQVCTAVEVFSVSIQARTDLQSNATLRSDGYSLSRSSITFSMPLTTSVKRS